MANAAKGDDPNRHEQGVREPRRKRAAASCLCGRIKTLRCLLQREKRSRQGAAEWSAGERFTNSTTFLPPESGCYRWWISDFFPIASPGFCFKSIRLYRCCLLVLGTHVIKRDKAGRMSKSATCRVARLSVESSSRAFSSSITRIPTSACGGVS